MVIGGGGERVEGGYAVDIVALLPLTSDGHTMEPTFQRGSWPLTMKEEGAQPKIYIYICCTAV